LTPQGTKYSAKSANQSLLRLQRAAFKIVYRIRADRRINALKRAAKSSAQTEPTVTKQEIQSKEKAKLTVLPKRIVQYVKQRKVPIEIPQAPEVFQPRPMNLIVPSYAERMGYAPLPIPNQPFTLQVQTPQTNLEHSGTNP
jgi:hypothetical protein